MVSAAHCATRLRLVTVDNARIDMKKLEDVEGVKGVFSNNGQLQLIIGTGTVNKVYDEFLAVSSMIMIHTNLLNAWSIAGMEASEIPVWNLFGFPIRQVGYQGHVIPVIIAVWLMCQLEKWLHKHVPEMIDLFVRRLSQYWLRGF